MSKSLFSSNACVMSAWIVLATLSSATYAYAQQMTAANPSANGVLETRLDKLLDAIESVQQQIAASQKQIEALSVEVRDVRAQLGNADGSAHAAELNQAIAQLQEASEVQQAEIKQHDQTKVESGSKYPLKLSGMILFSSFMSSAAVNDVDQPVTAVPQTANATGRSFSATMQQSIVGIEATGPHLWGAHSGGDLYMDFFSEQAGPTYAPQEGFARLRTAHAYLDWQHASLTALVDTPLISPLQPTSLVYQAVAPLGWSGNLWVWTPQFTFKMDRPLGPGEAAMELGLAAPEVPGDFQSATAQPPLANQFNRQGAFEARVSYALGEGTHRSSLGASGYYNRQRYAYGQTVDAWAGTLDWHAPLGSRAELSGEFYRGSGIGGLGGGAYRDYYYDLQSRRIEGLDAVGGWAQIKFRATRTLEANLAGGTGQSFASELRNVNSSNAGGAYSTLARNNTLFVNVIYRPKAYLLFSAEYRNLLSAAATNASNKAQIVGLAAGYMF